MKHDLTFPINSLAGLASGHAPRVFYPYREKQVSRRASTLPWTSTSDRSASNDFMRTISPLWQTLTTDDVLLWEDFAKAHPDSTRYGRFTQAGYNWFIRCNWLRQAARLPIQTQPPADTTTAYISDLTSFRHDVYTMTAWIDCTLHDPLGQSHYVYAKATDQWENSNRKPRNWEFKSLVLLSWGSPLAGPYSPGTQTLVFNPVDVRWWLPWKLWISLQVITADFCPGDRNRFYYSQPI